MDDECPDCAMGNCPVHDTLYEKKSSELSPEEKAQGYQDEEENLKEGSYERREKKCKEDPYVKTERDWLRCMGMSDQFEESLNEGEMPAGLKAYMDKKKGKKSDDGDKDEEKDGDKKESKKSSSGSKPDYLDLDKDGDKSEPMKDAAKDKKNESKIYIPENRSMYDLHDQRLFENLKKWAVKK
jgi:hypothetical protein